MQATKKKTQQKTRNKNGIWKDRIGWEHLQNNNRKMESLLKEARKNKENSNQHRLRKIALKKVQIFQVE